MFVFLIKIFLQSPLKVKGKTKLSSQHVQQITCSSKKTDLVDSVCQDHQPGSQTKRVHKVNDSFTDAKISHYVE